MRLRGSVAVPVQFRFQFRSKILKINSSSVSSVSWTSGMVWPIRRVEHRGNGEDSGEPGEHPGTPRADVR